MLLPWPQKEQGADLSYGPIHGFDISDSSPGPWRASLKFMSWMGVFLVLTFIGPAGFGRKHRLEETIDKRNTDSMLRALGRLCTVARNPSFSSLLTLFSLPISSVTG